MCQLLIAKDRGGEFGDAALYLQMLGSDRFQITDRDNWERSSPARGLAGRTKRSTAASAIQEALAQRGKLTRADLVKVGHANGASTGVTDGVLKSLREGGHILRTRAASGEAAFELAGEGERTRYI
ncbi:MAG: hypothetical protein HUU17_06930 [Chthonomonadales bacterium]|nr:hypothetical protein [Chthonomonadales bacterium]